LLKLEKSFLWGLRFGFLCLGQQLELELELVLSLLLLAETGSLLLLLLLLLLAAHGSLLAQIDSARLGSAQLDSPRSFALKFTRLKVACQVGGQNALIVWPQSCF